MTVQELQDFLRGIVSANPDAADLPIRLMVRSSKSETSHVNLTEVQSEYEGVVWLGSSEILRIGE
jgi:hypothetical protein